MSSDVQEPGHDGTKLGPGVLVLVVGASGVGKDALITGARAILADNLRVAFIERTVTRPPHDTEDHASSSDAEFDETERQGGFALVWHAHGLRYGVPVRIDAMIRDGQTVVVNGSRTITRTARGRYAHVCVILVESPIAIRAARIAQRGRETQADIQTRLSRTVTTFDPAEADVRIENSGALTDGIDKFIEALRLPRGCG